MATLERVDYKALASELMLSQFDESPIVEGIIRSWAEPIQQLEDALLEFTANNGITNATGVMLDIIGSWMGVARQGRLDEQYRTAILGRAATEGTDGTTESFLSALRVLTGSDQVSFFEVYPATLYPVVGNGWITGLVDELQRVRPAGVEMRLVLADGLNYQVFAEAVDTGDSLATQDGDTYQVLIDGIFYDLITTVVASSATYGTTTICGEDGISVPNEEPWADVVLTGAKVESGFVLYDDGTQMLDDQGNPIIFVGLGT